MKNTKHFEPRSRTARRAAVRTGDGSIVYRYLQWMDKRVVSLLSTLHHLADSFDVERKAKIDGKWQVQVIQTLAALNDYNKKMSGVDNFDHLVSSYKILRRSKKSWRVLFYDLLEVALVNAFIIMQEDIATHPGEIDRPSFSQMFRENLVCQLVGIADVELPPLAPYTVKREIQDKEDWITEHTPIVAGRRKNCLVCWREQHTEVKTRFICEKCTLPLQTNTPHTFVFSLAGFVFNIFIHMNVFLIYNHFRSIQTVDL